MASSEKIIIQSKRNEFKSVEPRILELAARDLGEINLPDQSVVSLNLQESQKRWLVVGICMNKIITPILRECVDQELLTVFNSLKTKLSNQYYSSYMKIYPIKKGHHLILKYENINNNHALKTNYSNFDYNVRSHIDFARLFLQRHMAKFTAFDDTCDSSAVLGLICQVNCFSKALQTAARNVRDRIRNPWAHPNFTDWDDIKYLDSFQAMELVIRALPLPTTKENDALTELQDWQNKGLKLCVGSCCNELMIAELKTETTMLATYITAAKTDQDSEFETLNHHLKNFSQQIEEFQSAQHNLVRREELEETQNQLSNVESSVQLANTNISQLSSRVDAVTNRQEKLINEVELLKSSFAKSAKSNREDTVTNTVPSRVKFFTGRTDELSSLKDRLVAENGHKIVSVCGLGGCGKTSLAIEYAWMFKTFYPGQIYWVSAENDEAFTNSINKIANEFGITGKNFSDTYESTLKWMAGIESKWLLVVDNLDQYELSDIIDKLFQEQWRRNSKGHILITTRREVTEITETTGIDEEDCIEIKCLTIDEGVTFMFRRTGRPLSEHHEAVVTLVNELGGLPLALEQAAAYITKVKTCTFESYLEQFKSERLKLLTKRKVIARHCSAKDRLTVNTTWKINFEYVSKMSEEEGYGQAAANVMQISAFLAPDDIPMTAINIGSPEVKDGDLREVLKTPLGRDQILEILTKFSLFQTYGRESYGVHRVLQEVIRNDLDSVTTCARLESGICMLNMALEENPSPFDVLYTTGSSGTSKDLSRLHLWRKLSHHVCTLLDYVEEHVKRHPEHTSNYLTPELATLLYQGSIYQSVNKRQAKALDLQNKKNGILATLHDLEEAQMEKLTAIKIPLGEADQTKIQIAMKSLDDNVERSASEDVAPESEGMTSEDLRIHGNIHFKEGNYHDAIRLYGNAICLNESDSRLYSNRSLCYLKVQEYEKALQDADQSIKLEKSQYKHYIRRAFALSALQPAYLGTRKTFLESSGYAAASIAAHQYPPCNLESSMRVKYPILIFKEIRNEKELLEAMQSKFTRHKTTLLLHPGRYKFALLGYQDLQIVGLQSKDKVTIDCVEHGTVVIPNAQPFNCHFENLTFEGSTLSVISTNMMCSFYGCTFSNGQEACEDFPKCKGGSDRDVWTVSKRITVVKAVLSCTGQNINQYAVC